MLKVGLVNLGFWGEGGIPCKFEAQAILLVMFRVNSSSGEVSWILDFWLTT